ncbi:MAG: TFIIB-type zinc ribbon-containing protein [Eubacteriales bacterium]|nr:TFIIB-type zinc ribbon-containing protein [Eubacteriales bacterium]
MAAVSYHCPNCGGELRFDPTIQRYKCDYCGSDFEVEEKKEMERETAESYSFDAGEDKREEFEGMVYTCPSCGAEIVTDETTAATVCYYCHTPVVLSGKLSGEYMPDAILPFAFDKKEAERRFLQFVKTKKYVPARFFQKKQIEMLKGVYFPFWVCECKAEGNLRGEGVRTRVWRQGDIEFTERNTYHVERAGQAEFKNIVKNALGKAKNDLTQGVHPFDLAQAKPFSMGYLAGFQAEKRDIEKRELEDEVEREVKNHTKKMLEQSMGGYSVKNIDSCFVHMIEEKWKYVLVPVWTLTYKGKNNEVYYYAMNGQDGKICGKFPISYKKLWLHSGLLAVAVMILCMIGGYLA